MNANLSPCVKQHVGRMKLDKPSGARSISLAEFIAGLKLSEQLDDELTPISVKEIWLATLSFDVRPDLVSEVNLPPPPEKDKHLVQNALVPVLCSMESHMFYGVSHTWSNTVWNIYPSKHNRECVAYFDCTRCAPVHHFCSALGSVIRLT
jgi:hypothetical protein